MEKIICKECGKEFSKFGIKNHIEFSHRGNKTIGCRKAWNKGISTNHTPSNKIPLDDILNGKHPQYQTKNLKPRLINEGLKEDKCEICEITEWNGKKINLELHHINGDGIDHRLDNLQIICPNCHSQTENYKNRNKGKSTRSSRK